MYGLYMCRIDVRNIPIKGEVYEKQANGEKAKIHAR